MKNIFFVTNYFGNGGAATVMKILIEKLPKNEYNIKLISFLDDDKKYVIPEGIEYINLSSTMRENKLEKLKNILKLRKILKSKKDSIIISFEYFINMKTIIANFLLKNKLIISERNDPNKSGNNKKKIRNFLYKFANVLVCQTNDAKNYFPKKIQKKTIVIPNPIREDLPNAFSGHRKKIIVTFCRIEKQKNLTMMIDSFKKVINKYPEYKLVIYGDGSEKQNIIEYAKKENLYHKIEFKGFVQNLHEEILDCSMFISTSDFEGISNSMLEAMAIGLPTICTDCPCGGAKMVIEDGINGFLSPVKDSEKFAEKILDLLDNQELMKKISENSTKIKDKYSSSRIYEQWKKIIES